MDFEVAIQTRNRSQSLVISLLGLLGQQEKGYKIKIYDNGEKEFCNSSPYTYAVMELLQEAYDVEIIIHRLKTHDFFELRQIALERCEMPVMLYLDDDIYMMPRNISRCIETLKTFSILPEFAYVCSSILDYKNVAEHDDYSMDYHKVSEDIPEPTRIYTRYPEDEEATLTTNMLSTACVYINVDRFRKVGGFEFHKDWKDIDTEDTVISRRLELNGYSGLIQCNAVAFHFPIITNLITPGAFRDKLSQAVKSGAFDEILYKEIREANHAETAKRQVLPDQETKGS